MSVLESNHALMDHMLKQKKLVFEFSITANATPASKVHASDINSVVYLRTQGKTADADAIEDLSASFTAPADNSTGNSTFGVLLTELGSIEKVTKITVTEKTSLATSLATTKLGTDGLSSGGNIAFEIVGTGLALDTESPTMVVEIDYQASK